MSISQQQLYKNSLWTFIELTSFPILVIFSTPFFISKLGIEQYGLWMLINTITQAINILNIGIGDSSISLISKYRTSGQIESIRKVFSFNFSFSIFLFFISLFVGCLLYQTNFISIFYKTTSYQFANTLLLLTCFSAGMKFIEVALLSVFKGYERFDLYSKLSTISKCTSVLLAVALALGNNNLLTILFGTLCINALNIILQIYSLYLFQKKIIQWPSIVFLRDHKAYLKYNFWFWLQSSIGLLGFLADKLAVAWFANIKTLGYYYIASMVGTNIHNFFMSFGSFVFPRVSYKLEAKDSILPLYYFSRGIIAMLGFIIIFSLVLFGDPVFEMWLGTETYINSIYFIHLYLVFTAGMIMIIVPFFFINGSKQIQLNSFFELTLRSTHFLCMILGHYYFGVSGILYGLIFSTFLNVPLQYYYFHKRILQVKDHSWLLIIMPVACLLVYLIVNGFIFKLTLALAFLLSIKLIYFDTAKPYFGNISFYSKIKSWLKA